MYITISFLLRFSAALEYVSFMFRSNIVTCNWTDYNSYFSIYFISQFLKHTTATTNTHIHTNETVLVVASTIASDRDYSIIHFGRMVLYNVHVLCFENALLRFVLTDDCVHSYAQLCTDNQWVFSTAKKEIGQTRKEKKRNKHREN